jgi:hypothetical protein
MRGFDGCKEMLSQNPTVVWAIAVSPKDKKGDRINSTLNNETIENL